MQNIPVVKPAIVAVSRSCFPLALSERRRSAVVKAYGEGLYECPVCIEQEEDVGKALADVRAHGANALVVYLGNFGPETYETLLCQEFGGPVMFCAAAEGDGDLVDGRGDAFCGMLNASYNLGLRGLRPHIPSYPVGSAGECARMIREWMPAARAYLGVKGLKVISFGPRPADFLACNAPIKGLYDLGVEIEENSELDLLAAYHRHEDDGRIATVVEEMRRELGRDNPYEGILDRLAQYELTLLDWVEEHRGRSAYVALTTKCWPAFQTEFRFVPCYVNSRLTARGIPVSCEVDIYGTLSEFIGTCLSGKPVTLLDINNTVPASYLEGRELPYTQQDLFMGFHCGNTASCLLRGAHMGFQRIMKRDLEPEGEPDITRGTIEGDIMPGKVTVYRLQGKAEGGLSAYAAQGEVLDMPTKSFGSIGVFAVPQMGRFYRHVLLERHFPHHAAVMFGHYGRSFFDLLRMLGVREFGYNQPANLPYPTENPFEE